MIKGVAFITPAFVEVESRGLLAGCCLIVASLSYKFPGGGRGSRQLDDCRTMDDELTDGYEILLKRLQGGEIAAGWYSD